MDLGFCLGLPPDIFHCPRTLALAQSRPLPDVQGSQKQLKVTLSKMWWPSPKDKNGHEKQAPTGCRGAVTSMAAVRH